MLLAASIRKRASACASTESGTCTAIWSPSKSALKAVQHRGCSFSALALDQDGLEGLDAQAVQGRRAVEHHGMLLDDLLQHVPDLGLDALDGALGGLDVVRQILLDQALHDEGLEQLERHLLGQAALIQLQAAGRPR